MQEITTPVLLNRRARTKGLGYRAMGHINDALDELALIRKLFTDLARFLPPDKFIEALKLINSAANAERALLTIPTERTDEEQ